MQIERSVIVKWVGALLSGDYTQGKQALRKTLDDGSYSYCCLGVLCDIIDPEGWKKYRHDDYWHDFRPDTSAMEFSSIFDHAIPTGNFDNSVQKLMTMNDGDMSGDGAKTFVEIASAVIEMFLVE